MHSSSRCTPADRRCAVVLDGESLGATCGKRLRGAEPFRWGRRKTSCPVSSSPPRAEGPKEERRERQIEHARRGESGAFGSLLLLPLLLFRRAGEASSDCAASYCFSQLAFCIIIIYLFFFGGGGGWGEKLGIGALGGFWGGIGGAHVGTPVPGCLLVCRLLF